MSEEVKNVVKGEYSNQKLDNYMEDLLLHCILTLDMSAYMRMRNLRTQVICGGFEFVQQEENELVR